MLTLLLLALPACSAETEEQQEARALPDLAERLEYGQVRAGIVTKPEDLLEGLKAEGRAGDIKLYNAHAAFIVEGARQASGYRYYGGNLVDADIIRPEGRGRVLYGETVFSWDLQVFQPREVEVISDGSDGVAHVRLTGKAAAFPFADDLIRAVLDPPRSDLDIIYDYRLEAGDSFLQLGITIANPSDETVELENPLILASHGDGVHLFAPERGFAGAGTGPLPYLGFVSRDLSYALLAEDDDLVMLFEYDDAMLVGTTGFEVFPGQTWLMNYYFVVTDQSAAGIQDARRALIEPEDTGTLEGAVELPSTAQSSSAWIAVMDGRAAVTTAPVTEDGSFQAALPRGEYQVHAYAPGHAPADPVAVTVSAGASAFASLSLHPAARITSDVSTPDGRPVNSRVTFFRQGDTPSPFAMDSVQHGEALRAGVSGMSYVLGEPETIVLPAGRYRAVATRGPTWEMDEHTIEVGPGEEASASFEIEQAVDTTGWTSADLHLHAYMSPDSHVPFEVRVKQAATDALDIPLLTEHLWAAGLQDTVEELGLEEHVLGVAGQEVTTLVYGHFNVFPLVLDPERPNNGGIEEHGRTPPELVFDMRTQHAGETIVQINHPRGANPGSYFSYMGLDADADTVQRDEDWTLDWELIEVFNASCRGDRNMEALADWIGMTNHGHRKTISGGSDSHTERTIPGTPRNWILVDAAGVREDHQKLVAPLRDRRSFVSCGPFVRFEAEDGTGLGGMTTVDDEGLVRFRVKVEAPTWMRVNTVRLLENGAAVLNIDVRASNGQVLRLDEMLEVRPEADAWYAVEVLGSGSLAPVSWSGPPYAITNPIEVDADRDGKWAPRRRTANTAVSQ